MGNSKTVCYAPLVSRVVWQDGKIAPCCVYEGDIGSCKNGEGVDQEKIDQLLRGLESHGSVNACHVCWEREKLGSFSTRSVYSEPGTEVSFLEFNFSSLCHLKCRMCDPSNSSSWLADHKKMSETLDFLVPSPGKLMKAFESREDLISYLDSIDIEKVKFLIFKGGEPLLHDEVRTTLEYFRDKKCTDVNISLNTSGQVPHEKLLPFKFFPNVNFTISIEGTGNLYSYIRGGKKFSIESLNKSLDHLKSYSNINIISNSAITPYSYFNLVELFDWIVTNIPDNSENAGLGIIYPVTVPEYVSYRAIPQKLRKEAYNVNLKKLRDLNISHTTVEEIHRLLGVLLAPNEEHDPILLQRFIKYTLSLDQLRGETMASVIPEYLPMVNQWEIKKAE